MKRSNWLWKVHCLGWLAGTSITKTAQLLKETVSLRSVRNSSVNRVGNCGQKSTFSHWCLCINAMCKKNRRAAVVQVTKNINAGHEQNVSKIGRDIIIGLQCINPSLQWQMHIWELEKPDLVIFFYTSGNQENGTSLNTWQVQWFCYTVRGILLVWFESMCLLREKSYCKTIQSYFHWSPLSFNETFLSW